MMKRGLTSVEQVLYQVGWSLGGKCAVCALTLNWFHFPLPQVKCLQCERKGVLLARGGNSKGWEGQPFNSVIAPLVQRRKKVLTPHSSLSAQSRSRVGEAQLLQP